MKTVYQCTNCGELDSDSGDYPPAPTALICSRCKEGRGLSPADQIRAGRGMLPLIEEGQ